MKRIYPCPGQFPFSPRSQEKKQGNSFSAHCFRWIFSAFDLLLSAGRFASHIVGGVLNYVYNSADSYTVYLILYRDCDSGNAAYPTSVNVTVLQADGSLFSPTRNFVLNPTGPATPIPLTLPPCATAPNPSPC